MICMSHYRAQVDYYVRHTGLSAGLQEQATPNYGVLFKRFKKEKNKKKKKKKALRPEILMLKIPRLKVSIEIYSSQDILRVFCHIFPKFLFLRDSIGKVKQTHYLASIRLAFGLFVPGPVGLHLIV